MSERKLENVLEIVEEESLRAINFQSLQEIVSKRILEELKRSVSLHRMVCSKSRVYGRDNYTTNISIFEGHLIQIHDMLSADAQNKIFALE